MLARLIDKGLLHYVAMDLKAPYNRYESVIGCYADMDKIKESIRIIRESGIDYEFRTTFSPDLTSDDILEIAEGISGAKLYVIQQFKPNDNIIKKYHAAHSPNMSGKPPKKPRNT
jgi:pyruvate formate lyase activating enzyme